jgi:uncharacterized membrane protein YhaH (DUF805 family)
MPARRTVGVTVVAVIAFIQGIIAVVAGIGLIVERNNDSLAEHIVQPYVLFSWNGHYLWQGIWQILVALAVLWLLFNPRADAFFESR